MAKRTGHTIAGVPHAARWICTTPPGAFGRCLVGRRFVAVPAGFVRLMLLVAVLAGARSTHAETPGPKSRYRSAARDTGGQADADQASTPNGLLGLGAIFRGGDEDANRERDLIRSLPLDRLTPQARQRIFAVTDQPTLYRQLPTQAIRCDEELFLFLTRQPETIIGIWDLMGITKVQATRTGPFQMDAIDGSGTSCHVDLLYGDRNLHIFVADGMYDGKFTQKPITGKGIFVLQSSYAKAADGSTTVSGSLDCYVKFESLGADLIARSLGGLIGKSADHNFTETAKFISQISQACETNPNAMLEMADQLPQVDGTTKARFARVIVSVAAKHLALAQQPPGVRPAGVRTPR
ncbi:hypothetical protein FYK55_14480 [Roseiconus nitratireducens]|uniref:Uncharacterized protein n=1 Tax=Roseiconus nitratireducens TaxID=2605748 RepID=A0A5M6D5E1_9BACT|nr:hypothetical protein [Roseiconus nitratireducens]KAA5542727.1 hypothetical protein FYK55_14480 [Roseiconus nitratireducens]